MTESCKADKSKYDQLINLWLMSRTGKKLENRDIEIIFTKTSHINPKNITQ